MSRDYALIGLIVLAFALWYFAFQTDVWNFWVRLSLAAALLATIALIMTPDRWELFRARPRDIAIGVASALLLYAIFWVGKQLALAILPFAADQIQSVYAKRGQLDLLSIGLLLFFLLGPSEEIFWRGFVQRRLSQKGRPLPRPLPDTERGQTSSGQAPPGPYILPPSAARRTVQTKSGAKPGPPSRSGKGVGGLGLGERSAWLVTTALYALVHIWTLNLLLLVAAGVAGLLWGWLYQREQSLITVIISHALWDVSIFVLFPLL
jgi:membrane protease YdiL (CAAX protease family)